MSERTSTVLLVEDDDKLAEMTGSYLLHYGFQVVREANGAKALNRLSLRSPESGDAIDFVVLDLNLPGLDGIEVCRRLRAFSNVPVLMATARVDEIDRLMGLEIGADDYLCKPYSPRELVARIKAILRRSRPALEQSDTQVPDQGGGRLLVDVEASRVYWYDGQSRQALTLTHVEYRLLSQLVLRTEQVFSRAQLLDLMHADYRDTTDRTIDTHIKNLRKKLKDSGVKGAKIASIYGLGYRMEIDDEAI